MSTDAALSAIAGKVGNLVGTLFDYSLGLVVNVIFLSRKADEVAEEMDKLQCRQKDLMLTADAEARQNLAIVSNQLSGWTSRVRSLAADAAKFQRSYDDRSTCITRFRLGYDAVELLKQARKLALEGNDFSGSVPLTCPQGRPDPVEQVPAETSSSTLEGGREALRRVEGYIMDDGVGIISIYGMVADEMGKLQSLRDDLMHKAEAEARQTQANVSNQLERWASSVASLAEDAAKFQRSLEDRSTCITRFRLGYDAVELLKQVRKLALEGNDFSGSLLICPREPDPVEQVPSEATSSTLAGGREALERVQNHIMDERVGIIGIYGMGGVGKTTLLKIINNEFLKRETCSDKFDVAIWVTVSRDVQISSIREIVARRLGLSSNTSRDELFRHLSEKRFILLLDDVWRKLDLVETGIPHPQTVNHSGKILFTTRYEQVCGEMDADQMVKINSLDDGSSWELFRSKLGRGAAVLDNNPSIRQLAEEVVRRCGGLPIALITVGRAMFSAKTAYEWEDAIRKLDQCAAELSTGMEDVLKSLKFSFDMLKDEAHRNCLLYCALFPEDFEIPKREIIDLWIGEGFLDPEDFDEDNIEVTRCRGNALISELQNACLLEETFLDEHTGRECVKLHDTVRDMALWIAGYAFVVLTGSNNINVDFSKLVPRPSIWENAERISLMYNHTTKDPAKEPSPPSSSFPNLTTLLLEGFEHLDNFGKKFLSFTSMPALRVLDLNYAGLWEFPIEITSLTSLQYLGLRLNYFPSLPVELGNLTNLRILILRDILRLTSIPAEAISRLSRLQVLDMMGSGYEFGDFNTCRHLQQLELSDLANLKRLSELYLPFLYSWATLGVIAASPVLRRSTRNLVIKRVPVSPPPPQTYDSISEQIGRLWNLRSLHLEANPFNHVMGELQLYPIGRLQNLEELHIEHFKESKFSINNISGHGSEPLFPRLRELEINNCDGCPELTWVGRLPCLEKLDIMDCKGLREVMMPLDGGGSHDHHPIMTSSFPKLNRMSLCRLPSLRSISTSTLLFPCLERLEVYECPRLQRLPFGPQSAKNLRKLMIYNCDGCSELTWVGRLPCLEELLVRGCEGLREVMLPLDGGCSHDHHPIMPSSFPKLKAMILWSLPSLRSINASTLLFPCLKWLYVYECPRLQRLPFGLQSAENLDFISGTEAWWDGLEWDDDAHQQSFSSKFREWDDYGAEGFFEEF